MGAWLSHFMMAAAAEITNTCGSLCLPREGAINPSLLGQRGDDIMLPEQRVLLVLQLDLGAAVLGQEHRVANLEEGIGIKQDTLNYTGRPDRGSKSSPDNCSKRPKRPKRPISTSHHPAWAVGS